MNPTGLSAAPRRGSAFLAAFAITTSILAAPAVAERTPPPAPASTTTPAEPSLVDLAKVEAKRTGKEVEIPSLHTENMTTFATPGGKTVKTYVSSTVVRVRRDGEWHKVDPTLVVENGVVRPRMAKLDLKLSNGGTAPLLVAKGEFLGLKQGSPGEISIAAPGNLPAPELSGQSATYRSVYGRGIDLVVTVTPTGYQQQIVIRERPAKQLKLPVRIDPPAGMSIGKSAKGKPAALAGGKEIADLSALPITDAKETARPGSGRAGTATTTLKDAALVLSPDAAFLADPAVTYPVTVAAGNPTPWHGAGAPADTFIANGGSYVNGSYSANSNAIFAGRRDGYNYRSYLKFDLRDAPFMGRRILDANVTLWNYISHACGEVGGVSMHRVAAAWTPTTITWSGQPLAVADGHVINPYGKDANCSGWMAEGELWYSIEEIAQAWANGTANHGLMVRSVAESGGNNWRQYLSGNYPETSPDGSHHPYFFLEYEAPSPPKVDGFTFMSPDPITSLPTFEEARARSVYEPEGSERTRIDNTFAGRIAGRREGEPFEAITDELDRSPSGNDGEDGTGEDTLGPRVLSVEPANGAADVPLDTKLKATFSEPVTEAALLLKDAGGVEVAATATYDGGGTVVTFTPERALTAGTTYTAVLSDAADEWENRMITHTWSFSTPKRAAGHWTFDEGSGDTASDSSGKGHDAKLNETASWTAGKNDTGLTNAPASPASPARRTSLAAAPTVTGFALTPSQTTSAGIVTSSLTPALKATPTDAASAASTVEFRVLKYSDDSHVWSGSVANVPSGTQASLAVAAGKLLDGVKYEWQVRATSAGGASAWSAYQYFTVDVPEAVVDQFQLTPSSGTGADIRSSSLTPTMKARVTDPLGGPAAVDVQVARWSDDVVVWSTSLSGVASGSQISVTVPAGKLLDLTKYEWRVRATTPGSTPAWTPYQYFTVDAAPAVDQLQVTPSTGTGDTIVTSTLTPTLRARLVDKLGNSGTVDFQVARWSDDVVVWSGSVQNVASGAQASIAVPAGKLLDGIKYEWRVKGTGSGASSPWTPYQYFTVNVPEPVVDQFQLTPSTGSGTATVTSSLTPTLRARVTDALGGPSTVEFQVADWATDTVRWSRSLNDVASGGNATVVVPGGVLSDGVKYEWRVRATTPGSTPAWSSWQIFTVDVPEAVVDQFQVTPSETVGTSTVTASLTPTLLARVTDALGGASTVDFQVADWATDTVFWSASVTGVASGSVASVTVPAGRLSDRIEYEFRVRATTPGSTPGWSPWQRFRTDVFDPATDPAVSQLQVVPSQTQDGMTLTPSLTPELRALVSHPQGGASRVEVELEHDPAAPQGQGSGRIWAAALDNVASGTAVALPVAEGRLADGWLVRWRLRSLAGANSSTWSAWQQVKVAVPKPGVGQLQVTPSQVVDGKTVTTVLTPSLHAQVTYAPGGRLRAEFEVEHDPSAPEGQGTGQIWATSAEGAAGSQVAAAVPAGKFTDGWIVRWRVRSVAGTAASAWSDWQQLVVDQPDSAPAVQELQVTPSEQVDGKTVTSTVTPQLRATVLDPRGEALTAEFEIEHDPAAPSGQGTGQIWATSAEGAAGAQVAAAVPAGKLTDGWVVRWRTRAVSATAASAWSGWQQFTVEIPKPGVDQLAVSPSEQVGGRTVTPVLTPSLRARVTYGPGGDLRAEFEVEHDPSAPEGQGTGQIWTNSAEGAAGAQVAAAVPAGKLSDGWVVRWRVRSHLGGLASAWSGWQQLVVDRPDSVPAVDDLKVTPSKKVGDQTVTRVETPTLSAKVADPRGDALTAEFEIEHDPAAPSGQGSGPIWAGNVAGVEAGSQAALAVPAGKLTDGWLVRWRARATSATAASAWSDWQVLKVDVVHPGEEPLAQTADPVIRTDESFTVAAWLRWSDANGDYDVVAQKGGHQAPFRLGNDPEDGLVFTFTSADTAGATVEGALSGRRAPVEEWFHLAGVYDAAAKTASLYLNGALIKSAPVSFTTWNAATAMALGSRMRGSLDEVQVFQRTLDATQILALLANPAAPPSAKAKTSAAAAVAGNFQYKHPSLETCYATQRAPRFLDAYSRMQERPHSACWTTWIGHGGWEEVDENGVKKRKNRTAWWVKLFPGPLRIPAALLDKVTDDDVFTFRATWVAHTYIGNHTGDRVYKGGSGADGLKPQNIKFFLKLSDFGIWNRGVRQTHLDDDLNDVQIEFDLGTEGGCAVSASSPSPTQLKTISNWRSTAYLEYLINTTKPANHDREVCQLQPAITKYEAKRGRLPLWDQEILGDGGNRLGVVRWGQGIPVYPTWSPSFRCDWRQLGNFGEETANTGGCIYMRADRVFTMSKSRDDEFLDVINHIEKAMDPARNHLTYPPYRPGDTTDGRIKNRPPVKGPLGNELPKLIGGNYAAAPNTLQGAALWRAAKGVYAKNRRVFSGTPFAVPEDDYDLPYGGTYCRYYSKEVYQQWGYRNVQCDEYPFASTEQGAAKDKIHYSVQGVRQTHNEDHGDALKAFYGHYRLLDYDPENTITKVSDSPFWVKIVN
ncbi:DNRLRE domain-containing protein [Nonomuraea sp. NPDC050790]|uniref:DNRLRE domain-containing protein n=1 Tax=Nonomuraea sp. NPDC050790 TaxID=3364371 RepID=UPI0037BAF036